jgi:hypothetical protein
MSSETDLLRNQAIQNQRNSFSRGFPLSFNMETKRVFLTDGKIVANISDKLEKRYNIFLLNWEIEIILFTTLKRLHFLTVHYIILQLK